MKEFVKSVLVLLLTLGRSGVSINLSIIVGFFETSFDIFAEGSRNML
jgi:hypothetical protein